MELRGLRRVDAGLSAGRAVLPAYGAYFGVLAFLAGWPGMAARDRKARFRVFPVVKGAAVAGVLGLALPFPQPWGLGVAVLTAVVTQAVSPWSEPAAAYARYAARAPVAASGRLSGRGTDRRPTVDQYLATGANSPLSRPRSAVSPSRRQSHRPDKDRIPMKRFFFWLALALIGTAILFHGIASTPAPPGIAPYLVRVLHDRDHRVYYLDRHGRVLHVVRDVDEPTRDDDFDAVSETRREPAEGLPVPVVPGLADDRGPRRAPRHARRRPHAGPVRRRHEPGATDADAPPSADGLLSVTGRLSATEERARKDARGKLEDLLTERLAPEVPRTWKVPPELIDRMIRAGRHRPPRARLRHRLRGDPQGRPLAPEARRDRRRLPPRAGRQAAGDPRRLARLRARLPGGRLGLHPGRRGDQGVLHQPPPFRRRRGRRRGGGRRLSAAGLIGREGGAGGEGGKGKGRK